MNMRKATLSLTLLLALAGVAAFSKETKDTLTTSQKDRVIITYNVVKEADRMTVTLTNVRLRLGETNGREYDDDNVVVAFFDRKSSQKNYEFTGLPIETVKVPESLGFDASEGDGHHILQRGQQSTDITFTVEGDAIGDKVTIPIFLAEYKKAGWAKKKLGGSSQYVLFAKCSEPLRITVPKSNATTPHSETDDNRPAGRTVEEEFYVEEEQDLTETDVAKSMLDNLETVLRSTDVEELKKAKERFENLQYNVDRRLQRQMNNAIEQIRDRIDEVNSMAESVTQQNKDDVSARAQKQMAKVKRLLDEQKELPFTQECQDAIEELVGISEEAGELGMKDVARKANDLAVNKAAEKKSDIEKKKSEERTVWAFIIVILIAMAAFVGNQVFQIIRIRKTRDLANRAQMEAEQRARSAIRSKAAQAEGKVKQKVSDIKRANITGMVKKTNTKGRKMKV